MDTLLFGCSRGDKNHKESPKHTENPDLFIYLFIAEFSIVSELKFNTKSFQKRASSCQWPRKYNGTNGFYQDSSWMGLKRCPFLKISCDRHTTSLLQFSFIFFSVNNTFSCRDHSSTFREQRGISISLGE